MSTHRVYRAEDSSVLPGWASPELIARSEAEGHTGIVPATYDGRVWRYVPPPRVDDFERIGDAVTYVYVI